MLLRSGEQFSTYTVQGRYLALHFYKRDLFNYYSSIWKFDRLIDLIVVAGMRTVEESSSKHYAKNVGETKDMILDMINPQRVERDRAREAAAKDDEKKKAFLDIISAERPEGFKSLDDLKASISRLAQTVQEMSEDQ